jgi:ATP-dependent Clp protease ATP-binding subunit ClpA
VVISDESLRAAVDLTDKHQTDRRRPDRALDVLDEACAHTHAIANYSSRAESLIQRRRELLRGSARADRRLPEPEAIPVEDRIDSGFAALAQFGAELESIFIGPTSRPESRPEPAPEPTPPPVPSEPPPPPAPVLSTLGEVEAELSTALVQEGIVVRGIDIARVVAVATGREVTWAA